MANVAWEIIYAVETSAGPAFAWKYWSTVSNWDDPPAAFELLGPFQAGSRGITRIPGQPPIEWFLREVRPPHMATIAIPLVQAVLSFEWRFDGLPDGRTRISQRITLEGENAEAYRSQVASTFAVTVWPKLPERWLKHTRIRRTYIRSAAATPRKNPQSVPPQQQQKYYGDWNSPRSTASPMTPRVRVAKLFSMLKPALFLLLAIT
jgi:hypothetical protein